MNFWNLFQINFKEQAWVLNFSYVLKYEEVKRNIIKRAWKRNLDEDNKKKKKKEGRSCFIKISCFPRRLLSLVTGIPMIRLISCIEMGFYFLKTINSFLILKISFVLKLFHIRFMFSCPNVFSYVHHFVRKCIMYNNIYILNDMLFNYNIFKILCFLP